MRAKQQPGRPMGGVDAAPPQGGEDCGAGEALETLVLIPARGGSKGIPDKNIVSLGGVPLLAHTIRAALAAPHVGRVVVTTESARIRDIALEWGAEVPFLRPPELAGDDADMGAAIRHARKALAAQGYVPDAEVVLLATSPFRPPGFVERAVHLLRQGYNAVLAVRETALRPCDLLAMDAAGRLRPLGVDSRPRRLVRPYGLLTAQRMWDRVGGKGTFLYRITNPLEGIDIDTPADLELARRVLAAGLFTPCLS